MKKKILLGTRNLGKIERFKKLLAGTGLDLEIHTPEDLGLEDIEAEESGKTLAENAALKARAYSGQTDMAVLANDTGCWVEGEGFINAPKRMALGRNVEKNMTKEEISEVLLGFWQGVARKHGGRVNAAWLEAFALLEPDGTMRTAESRREVILTDEVFGESHIQIPARALYISKATGKPAIKHTREEELVEMKPITDALIEIFSE